MDHPKIDAHASRVEQKQQRVPKLKDLGEQGEGIGDISWQLVWM